MTFEVILNRALSRVSDNIDKREGSVIYTAIAPACAELAQLYIELDIVLNETFADTASREYLILRAAERGLNPEEASYAIVRGEFNLSDIAIGSRFSLDGFAYKAIEKISDGVYKLQCETVGNAPNGSTGTLIPIDYIDGLTSANITEVLIPGEEEEDTEVFRSRYFDSLESQAFGGNRADYKAKVLALKGVGGVKIYRATNVSGDTSGGNVKLVILNSEYGKPSETLVNEVQTAINPIETSGDGEGLAPLWHFVSISAVDEVVIDINTNITYQTGYSYEDVKSYIDEAIDKYYLSLAKEWQDSDNLVVRISQIEYTLLGVTGIIDITGTTINGVAVNLQLDANAIPIRGHFS